VTNYSEAELILPALEIISERHPPGIRMKDMLPLIRKMLNPTGEDLIKNEPPRKDDHFSQKVRNLTSHRALVRRGLATYEKDTKRYHITAAGRSIVEQGQPVLAALVEQGFSAPQLLKSLQQGLDNIILEEGARISINTTVYKRSQQLREKVCKIFVNNDGSITCQGCGFNGQEFYSDPLGCRVIEFHHLIPLWTHGGASVETSLSKALKQIVPLCPNCHRLVHLDRTRCMPINELKILVERSREKAVRKDR
jgi:predicted HNH restriction endonuclease